MQPTDDAEPPAQTPGPRDDALSRGEELLDRVKEVARRISERVNKALGDSSPEAENDGD